MRNTYLIFLAIVLLGFKCERNKDKERLPTKIQSQTVQYGNSFGMCRGYCTKAVVITQDKISYSAIDRQAGTKTCARGFSKTEWNNIYSKINVAAFNRLPTTIGCPDCADGGAEWIEITTTDSTHRVTFEYGKAPAAAEPYIEDLRNYLRSFDDCIAK